MSLCGYTGDTCAGMHADAAVRRETATLGMSLSKFVCVRTFFRSSLTTTAVRTARNCSCEVYLQSSYSSGRNRNRHPQNAATQCMCFVCGM
eukprot:359015-Chlamydomonas_euryale.AAC.2